MKQTIVQIYERDLLNLKEEISLYTNEENLWKASNLIKNLGGNLCLHLIGNLTAYIGVGLAKTSYERDRTFEFERRDVSKQTLITQIDKTITTVKLGLLQLDEKKLAGHFPILIWEEKTEMIFTLLHLHVHLNYHLGQINYYRRLLDL